MKVLISGAGIGGLAAARALIADGHEVTVFEQAAELRPGGAAVTLWSNGTGVLSELGVSLDGAGAPIDLLETRDHRGRPLVSVDVAQSAARYGHPNLCLSRARLLGLLAGDLPAGTIAFGRAARAAEETAGAAGAAVRVTFADGGTADGDLLIAADGRGSAIRDQLWGGDPGQPTGWATWQGLSPVPVDITTSRHSVLFVGKPGTCGLMPAGDGLLQWWFDLRWTLGTPPPAKPVAMLRERFGDWAPPVRTVLAAVTDDETGFFPHCRHRVPRTWGSGPITVIGDAAHSMPPTRAQGANQALEDAWALAAALRDAAETGAGTEAALRSFERARSRKASVVSRQAGSEDYNRYGAVLSRLIPSSLATRYYTHWRSWAYGYKRRTHGGGSARAVPVITAVRPAHRDEAAMPFIGLAEGYALAAFRKAGVPMRRIRPAIDALAAELGLEHALASRRLYTDGAEVLYDYAQHAGDTPEGDSARELVVVRNNQRVFTEVVDQYLSRVDFAGDGYARLIRLPQYRVAEVTVDPDHAFGRPRMARGGAEVDDVIDLFLAGEPVDAVAAEFGLSRAEVEDVLRASARPAA